MGQVILLILNVQVMMQTVVCINLDRLVLRVDRKRVANDKAVKKNISRISMIFPTYCCVASLSLFK